MAEAENSALTGWVSGKFIYWSVAAPCISWSLMICSQWQQTFYYIGAPCSCETTGYLEHLGHGCSRDFTMALGEGVGKQNLAKKDQETQLGLVSVGAWQLPQLFTGDATASQLQQEDGDVGELGLIPSSGEATLPPSTVCFEFCWWRQLGSLFTTTSLRDCDLY